MSTHDYLVVNQGSAYTSKEMKESVQTFRVHLPEVTIESAGAIGVDGRYYAPSQLVYNRIRALTDCQKSDQECLPIAVFTRKCTVRLDGLYQVLLPFSAFPQSVRGTPKPA